MSTSRDISLAGLGNFDPAVVEFIWRENSILDEWSLDLWASLFTEDGRYILPSTDQPDGDPRSSLMLINDDHDRIHARVKRLQSRDAHADYPRPRTRRVVSQILATETTDGALLVTSSLVLHAFRSHKSHLFVAHCKYLLVRSNGDFKIQEKRVELDIEDLRAAGGTVNLII